MFGQIRPWRTVIRVFRLDALMPAGNFQAELDRAGRQDEILERGLLRLPAEPADSPVSEAANPPLDLGEPGVSLPCGQSQDLVGYRVDQSYAEERRRVALGVDQGEVSVLDRERARIALHSRRDCPGITGFAEKGIKARDGAESWAQDLDPARFILGIRSKPMQNQIRSCTEAAMQLDERGPVRRLALGSRLRRRIASHCGEPGLDFAHSF